MQALEGGYNTESAASHQMGGEQGKGWRLSTRIHKWLHSLYWHQDVCAVILFDLSAVICALASATNGWHQSRGGRQRPEIREVAPVVGFKVETASRSPEIRAGGLRDKMCVGRISCQPTGDGEQLGGPPLPHLPPSLSDLPGAIQQQRQQQYTAHCTDWTNQNDSSSPRDHVLLCRKALCMHSLHVPTNVCVCNIATTWG